MTTLRRVLLLPLSAHKPEMGFNVGMFPEKTPEESDNYETPHENRPKTEKLGGINQWFSHRFAENLTVIPLPECED